jgi:hypothetical protein
LALNGTHRESRQDFAGWNVTSVDVFEASTKVSKLN